MPAYARAPRGEGGNAPPPFLEETLYLSNEGDLPAKISSLGVDGASARWASVFYTEAESEEPLPASHLPPGYLMQPRGPALRLTVRFQRPTAPSIRSLSDSIAAMRAR